MITLGLVGEKRSGKDTVFKIIKGLIPSAERVAFADALKQEVADGCDVTPEFIEEHKENFRLILQGWGSDFRRDLFSKNYWIMRAAGKLDILETRGCKLAVITDVRFSNEADFIRERGGILWRIDRPKPLAQRVKGMFAFKHASERVNSIHIDRIIRNDGTLDDLAKKVAVEVERGISWWPTVHDA